MADPTPAPPTIQDLSDQTKTDQDFKVHTIPDKFLSIRPSFKLGKSSKTSKGPMSIKKNLLIGIIVIVVLGGAMALAGWLFLRSLDEQPADTPTQVDSPTQDDSDTTAPVDQPQTPTQIDELPTDNQLLLEFDRWLTYDNSTHNYTLEYPTQWLTDENNQPNLPGDALQSVIFKDQAETQLLTINTFSNPQPQALLSWLESIFLIDQDDLESFSLHNYSAYKYEDQSANTDTIYVLFNQKIYALVIPKTDDDVLSQVYAQILINFEMIQTEQDQPPVFTPALDSDKDNLSDVEEELYATHKDRRDSDGDGYIDGDEVANLYDPNQSGGARLYDSQIVSTYVNSSYNYNIVHPASWSLKDQNYSVIFQDQNGEFVQVLITANQENFSNIKDWYQTVINSDMTGISDILVANNSAIRTADGMNVYFLFGNNIYSLIYNIGLSPDASFMTTFDMMIKSLRLMNPGS